MQVKTWDGPVGRLSAGHFSPEKGMNPKYIATGGMRQLATNLVSSLVAEGLDVRRPCWVSDIVADAGRGWLLKGKGTDQGCFDFVIIAHNGKCANRLLRPSGAPLVAKQMIRLELSSIWVALVAFDESVACPGDLEGAFVDDNGVLSWIANNNKKLGVTTKGPECWTLISTPAYGKANKVPQENVPTDISDKVMTHFRS
jgi:predicted NAD/FAD-dependent oxidoreductase